MKPTKKQAKLRGRRDDYDRMMQTSKAPHGAYHKPGSNKK